jgi:electron transfer flavoprotein beta subunit
VVDDSLASNDTHTTAAVLAHAVQKIGSVDLVLCGEGSADLYFQQVGLQVGELLGYTALNFISQITPLDGGVLVERTLEDVVEVLEAPLPAVLMVTTDINVPRLPTMKEILMAGKKPVTQVTLAELGFSAPPPAQTEVLETRVPPQAQRKQVMIAGTVDEAVQTLIGYLSKEGLI